MSPMNGGQCILTQEDRRAVIERLWQAAADGDTDRVRVILDEGMHDASGGNTWQNDADPRAWSRSPLHIAALNGHLAVVELLLSRGADVNALRKYGDTPIHLAISHDNVDVITMLYKAGADVGIENDDGDSAAPLGARAGLNFDWPLLGQRVSPGRLFSTHTCPPGG